MEVVIDVVAPEDLVDAGDRFSGDDLPLATVAAGRDAGGGVDLPARASAVLHEGLAIAATQQLGVALGFQGGGGSAGDAISGGIHLEDCFELPGPGGVEPIGAISGLQGPVGIEAPEVEDVGGVVAPEDLVGAGVRFSGDHLPLAAVAAHVHPPGGIDLLARSGAEFHEGQPVAATQKLGVALGFEICVGR